MRRLATVLVFVALGGMPALFACAPVPPEPASTTQAEEPGMREARQVLEAYREQWEAIADVQGTGIGVHEGRTVIFVYAHADSPELRQRLPAEQDGVPLVIRAVGPIEPLQ